MNFLMNSMIEDTLQKVTRCLAGTLTKYLKIHQIIYYITYAHNSSDEDMTAHLLKLKNP